MPILTLASAYNRLRLSDRKEQTLAKAYLLREQRLTRRDRLAAEIQYYGEVTGEYPKLVSADGASDPRISPILQAAQSCSGEHSAFLENMKDRLSSYVKRSALSLKARLPIRILPGALSRWIACRTQESFWITPRQKILESWLFHVARYVVGFLQNDRAAMDEEVRWAKNKPDDWGLHAEGTI